MLDSKDVCVSSQDLTTLLCILKYFSLPEKRLALQQWATQHAAAMSEEEAAKHLSALVTAASNADALKNVSFQAALVLELLAKAPQDLKPETVNALRGAVGVLLEKTLLEASCL